MKTILVSWSPRDGRHYISSAVDGDYVYGSSGIPRDLWDAGLRLVKLALADGQLLQDRGDRYEHGGYAVVVERVAR